MNFKNYLKTAELILSGINPKLSSMDDEFINITLDIRKRQLKRYNDDEKYRTV